MARAQSPGAKVLFDVFESAMEARAHWQCWWAIANEAKPHLVPRMNKYADFFLITERAHFNCAFINLGNLFDRRRDASSFESYFKLAKSRYTSNEFAEFRKRLASHEPARQGALTIRNSVIAHKSAGQSEKQVFQEAGVRPRQIHSLIGQCTDIVNSLAEREGWSNQVFVGDRVSSATLGLINSIQP
jgi:hypothetical protein